ncbi:MAG: bifunctional (p)ppGpp synthetase/guanosine-3',5'-bis(diphosphate) 3'-pyrophosphohydrolase [Rhodoferax sp.]|uniref:RelA/SpoT family protein n=1 Tax=Rhodoferax sp. TaxID=50421 RepID=UPI001B6BF1D9|nr:bifunctional (p)ppGpp synthetase/guanosine-3',5'-bis(diphosphate) 3'-pyrophosphohydrolase [Rhodoferax sp.]MBP9906559.1 bifunctional (p)ppGpp synthetase/guanosine-3',5'-bis(diphosphate) 3'-pyrophosphohydrolase [Rhodoferax sp.]
MKSTQTAPAASTGSTPALPSVASGQPAVLAATQQLPAEPSQAVARARAFAEPLLAGERLDSGENMLAHADAMVLVLQRMGGSEVMQAASYLVYACEHLNKPQEVISKAFGDHFAALALETAKLVRVQRHARLARLTAQGNGAALGATPESAAMQTENVRKMLLAFSRDLRVVLLRLASRLQTLRYFAAAKLPVPDGIASEALQVFAPLANRLGIWEIKWEMEDLAFRFLEPDTYKQVARWLDEKRVQREAGVERLRAELERDLVAHGLSAKVSGRPKHIYSIVKKMRGKSLDFSQVYDVRALRVLVASVPECYDALSWVHSRFNAIAEEFDDYIAKPKVNGYQSLHTVVRDANGQATEIQIRTQAMHDHAENGVAAHWAYKEAGAKGYAGVSASGSYDAKIAVLRQLLAWERDLSNSPSAQQVQLDDRIYVLTPDAAIVELPQGATAVDFAYTVHTSLGHRCRGARVDGAMVPLHTALKNGQTVEISVAKEGGPSRDWLNPELGYLVSHRARTKVRAWFNALALTETVAKGREAVEKLLQREGKTALKLDDLAVQLGFADAEALFEDVGKDEFSLRSIEQLLRPPEVPQFDANAPLLRKSRAGDNPANGGLLVVGVDSLLTQMAKCCKPAPPDAICGFVTRGKGVSVHRTDCTNLREMVARNGERLIEVEWGVGHAARSSVYPVDVSVQAQDRQGLLRDISEVFTKEKMNVTGVQTQSIKGVAWMTFTVEVTDSGRLHKVLGLVAELPGVRWARRK